VKLKMLNFLLWLVVGAVIGWFSRGMADADQRRQAAKFLPAFDEDDSFAE